MHQHQLARSLPEGVEHRLKAGVSAKHRPRAGEPAAERGNFGKVGLRGCDEDFRHGGKIEGGKGALEDGFSVYTLEKLIFGKPRALAFARRADDRRNRTGGGDVQRITS